MLQGSLIFVSLLVLCLVGFLVVRLWYRQSWLKHWLRGTTGLCLLAVMLVFVVVIGDIWSYHNLLIERPLATIDVKRKQAQVFDVSVVIPSHNQPTHYDVYGDQWQMDVRLLTWDGPIAALGVAPLYRLERLSGRYLSLEQERSAKRSVYAMSPSPWVDVWSFVRNIDVWLHADYGAAVYMPLQDGAVFGVYVTARGLEAKPMNAIAKDAVSRWK